MPQRLLGARIRERRRQIGTTQAALAQQVGISPSYMNLIERNKRAIAGPLLRRIAKALEVSLDDLDGASERRLLEGLEEVAHLPQLSRLQIEADRVGEFLGRFPGWARALAALVRSEQETRELNRALSDRLSHDPFLGESVHQMLTRIASVRSAVEILADVEDMSAEERGRFDRIVQDETRVLSDVGEALAAYFQKAEAPGRALTPLDEVEALFDARENRFAEIEAAVDSGLSDMDPVIDAILQSQPQIETEVARTRARAALTCYVEDALLAPAARFAEAAAKHRYDIETLAEELDAPVDVVCRRLTTLAVEKDVPRFGYLSANAAGAIVDVRSLRGMSAPRYAAACPLWALFRAQQAPGLTLRQRVGFPNGSRFVFAARSRAVASAGFGVPRHFVTDMLVMTEADAALTAYAVHDDTPVEQVGPSCRACPRRDCAHRVADPLVG